MCLFSLVAPVQADGDVSLDVPALVLGQVTRQQLPPQVDELHHHMAELVEEIHSVLLGEKQPLHCIRRLCRRGPGGGGATFKAAPEQTVLPQTK